MLLRCKRKFGNFTPGEEIEVPDGAKYDRSYFEAVEQPDQTPKKGDKK